MAIKQAIRMPLADRNTVSLALERPRADSIPYVAIRADGGTQMRAGLNQETVREYAELMTEGVEFPPVVVFYDGSDYWLADGFHRYAAWRLFHEGADIADAAQFDPMRVDIKSGTRRDAILYAARANNAHGLRRTPADKWRAAEALLVDDEWGQWSDREIARNCQVSPSFVAKVRAKLGNPDRPQYAPPPLPVTVHVDSETPQSRTYATKHGTTATMNTERIGTKAKPTPASAPSEPERIVPQVTIYLPRNVAELLQAAVGIDVLKYHLTRTEQDILKKALEEALQ